MNPPPEILAAAQRVTTWAAENNVKEFAIGGIQQRVWQSPPRAEHGIRVGQYTIAPFNRADWFLSNFEGEGMQISDSILEAVLDAYFRKHF